MLTNSEMLETAIDLAVIAHRGQLDKAGLPYILHPLYVMGSVDSIDAKIVAVLHDVIEDTSAEFMTTRDGIVCRGGGYNFPNHIIEAIDAITKRELEKKEDYWARVKANPLALQVKLADIAHNTSEKRLSVLSANEQAYLRRKYAVAIHFLLEK